MNRKQYNSDPRYAKVLKQMDLLNIMDVSTTRQHKNGTIVWKLPIKNNNSGQTPIEVASFNTGYVRNQNSGYSNYQLNKRCEGEPEYFQLANGDYRKFTTRSCKLIPNEIDRLEYLIAYCLKNYYIKNANEVTNSFAKYYDRVRDLEEDLVNMKKARDYYKASKTFGDSMYEGRNDRVRELENKLDTIQRIADHG